MVPNLIFSHTACVWRNIVPHIPKQETWAYLAQNIISNINQAEFKNKKVGHSCYEAASGLSFSFQGAYILAALLLHHWFNLNEDSSVNCQEITM